MPLQIKTLGCRLNQAESDGLSAKAAASGFRTDRNVIIINSCSVTSQADSRLRYLVRSTHRKNPDSQIFITGCLPADQQKTEELRRLPGVAGIISNQHKSGILPLIQDFLAGSHDFTDEQIILLQEAGNRNFRAADPFDYGFPLPAERVRASVKIQDGCDRRCTYCSVPFSRGRAVSRNPGEILSHVDFLLGQGIPEIVITGVNSGAYRWEESGQRTGIADLLERILNLIDKKSSKTRIRLSSIEPNHAGRELGRLTLHPAFCSFLHIPVQSASDRILRRMKRPYSKHLLYRNTEAVLKENPDIFTGTDIMTGFPGETEEDFAETISFLNEFRFAGIHPFRYSVREHTEAAAFTEKTDPRIQHQRMEILSQIQKDNLFNFVNKRTGKIRTAVTEKAEHGIFRGLTDDYLEVTASCYPDKSPARGSLQDVRITGISESLEITAELVDAV